MSLAVGGLNEMEAPPPEESDDDTDTDTGTEAFFDEVSVRKPAKAESAESVRIVDAEIDLMESVG